MLPPMKLAIEGYQDTVSKQIIGEKNRMYVYIGAHI